MAERIKTIAVGFDGPVHAYREGWKDGRIYDEPTPGAFDGLRALMEHYAVYIHTIRNQIRVANWLFHHGFAISVSDTPLTVWNQRGVLLVTNRKLPAGAYLDARAVRFTSWGQALSELLPGRSYRNAHERVVDALTDAWPDLANDPVYVDQLAHVALRAATEQIAPASTTEETNPHA